jgi:hypothetical protein
MCLTVNKSDAVCRAIVMLCWRDDRAHGPKLFIHGTAVHRFQPQITTMNCTVDLTASRSLSEIQYKYLQSTSYYILFLSRVHKF